MQEAVSSGEGIVTQMLDRIKGTARVEAAFGESRVVDGRTIVPVATVAYVFGAGGGAGTMGHMPVGDEEAAAGGSGSGGGGAVRVHPVAVLEITEDEARIIPVLDWTRIITTGITFLGIWMVLRTIFRRRR